jgi:hypothetical protein
MRVIKGGHEKVAFAINGAVEGILGLGRSDVADCTVGYDDEKALLLRSIKRRRALQKSCIFKQQLHKNSF